MWYTTFHSIATVSARIKRSQKKQILKWLRETKSREREKLNALRMRHNRPEKTPARFNSVCVCARNKTDPRVKREDQGPRPQSPPSIRAARVWVCQQLDFDWPSMALRTKCLSFLPIRPFERIQIEVWMELKWRRRIKIEVGDKRNAAGSRQREGRQI